MLRIVRGEPTPEEIAALVTVLAARLTGPAEPGAVQPPSAWRDRRRYVRAPLAHGPGAWRATCWPTH